MNTTLEPEIKTQTATWFFTFGSGHLDETGEPLNNYFVPITIEGDALGDDNGYMAARAKMHEARGNKWCTLYASADEAGVEEWGYVERSLESVSFDKERLKREQIQRLLKATRDSIAARIALVEKAESVLLRLPANLIEKAMVTSETIDLDRLTHDEVAEAMKYLGAGRWEKKLSGIDGCIDYTGTVDGQGVRLWAAAPPDTCRIIETEEVVPATTRIVRKLVCAPTP